MAESQEPRRSVQESHERTCEFGGSHDVVEEWDHSLATDFGLRIVDFGELESARPDCRQT